MAAVAIPLSASAQPLDPQPAAPQTGRFSLEVNGANAGLFSQRNETAIADASKNEVSIETLELAAKIPHYLRENPR